LHRLRWDSSALAQGQYTLCLTSRGIRRVVPLMK
jgi:hypothetical protein